jgi:hypothetical protein
VQTLLKSLVLATEPLQAQQTTPMLDLHASAIGGSVQHALNTSPHERPAAPLLAGLRDLQRHSSFAVIELEPSNPGVASLHVALRWHRGAGRRYMGCRVTPS